MLLNSRVILKHSSTLTDISKSVSDIFATASVVNVQAGDELYIGGDMPFNHRHFQLGVVNDQTAVASVEIWDGSDWNDAVDVQDLTSVSGVSLAQSGILSWSTDKSKGWTREDTTEDITELSTLKIYNMFWVRVSFSAALKATVTAKYVGHKFSQDSQLAGYWPDLARSAVKTAFSSGKTTWDEQHVLAAEEIIRDLRKLGTIKSANQINNWEIFTEASIHKVAEIVFTAFGEAKAETRKVAADRYEAAFNQLHFPDIDSNEDGHKDIEEKYPDFQWNRR